MVPSWPDLPCALKAAIGYGKQTLGDLASLPHRRGRSEGRRLRAPSHAPERRGAAGDVRPMPGSLRLDVGCPDDLGPLLDFHANESPEVGG
jgi:hypothetical protein